MKREKCKQSMRVLRMCLGSKNWLNMSGSFRGSQEMRLEKYIGINI